MSFSDLGLSPEVLRAVDESGYTNPTPIQEQAIPVVLMGRDVLGCAQTGTGKTASFTLPMIDILASGRARARMPRSLIIEPTRELATQVSESFERYGKYHKLSMALLIGGESFADQQKKLDRGVDVLIATPGRLLDLFERGKILLSDVKILVIDEADRMLDMGFIPDVERIVSLLPKIRQTLFFSATMPGPIQALSRELLHDAASINLERKAAPAVGIRQALYPVREELKPALFVELMRRGDIGNVIVFTRTKHRANRLADYLTNEGVSNAKIHGNRSQAQRTEALEGFKSGRYRCLVATDIVARGIDVEQLEHVVNFDVPHVPEDYIHRVGRTARADATGDAFTFVSPEEEQDLSAIERAVGKRLPRVVVPDFDYASKPKQRFEVPIAERIAEIRARKAEERKRAKEKEARRAANAARSAQPSSSRAPSRGAATTTTIAAADESRRDKGAGQRPKRRGGRRGGSGGAQGGNRPGGSSGPYR